MIPAATTALHVATWHDFSFAAVGIAGALAGLVFVALSLNIEFILEHNHLPARGGTALVILLGVAVVNLCVLVPGQNDDMLAAEMATVALIEGVCALQTARRTNQRRGPQDPLAWTLQPLAVNCLAVAAWIAAAVLLWHEGDLGLLALATITGILVPVWEAWVLLVEIRR